MQEGDMSIFGYLSLIIAVFVVLGNVLTLMSIYRNPRLQCKRFVYIVSLASVDLLCGVAYTVYVIITWKRDDVPGNTCAILVVFFLFPIWSSVGHMMSIAAERYIAILYPLRYHSIVKRKYFVAILIMVNGVALTCSLVPYFWRKENVNDVTTSCDTTSFLPRGYLLGVLMIPYSVVVVCMVAIYVRIFMEVRRQAHRVTSLDVHGAADTANGDRKAARMFSATFAVLVLFFLPFNVAVVRMVAGFEPIPLLHKSGDLLVFANSAMNCVIYAASNSTIRRTYLEICRCQSKDSGSRD